MFRIALIEDDDTMREGMAHVLQRDGHEIETFSNGSDAIDACQVREFDLIISDYRMRPMDGLQVFQALQTMEQHPDFILITAYGTIEMAVEAMKQGMSDYITKPFSLEEFRVRIEKILARRAIVQEKERLDEENAYLREQIDGQYNFGEIVGESPQIKEIFRQIQKVAPTDSSVLIIGESGTGKELVARAIHHVSQRAGGPFIKVNCGALVESLLESELFGHEKGAFTGATRQRRGKFELAHKGSIFLDEIGDISPAMQIKLLRVLQEHEFDRVGGEQTVQVDVRVIAATNQDLMTKVEESTFREDLYYRLNVIPIELPPLRERREDIALLVKHFVEKKARELSRPIPVILPEAMEALMQYNWPGNVRELENVLERALVLCDENTVGLNDLPVLTAGPIRINGIRLPSENLPLDQVLEHMEEQLIRRALERTNGVKTQAARLLGIKTSALYYKLEKYELV